MPSSAPDGTTVVQAVPHATTFIRGPALALAPMLPRLELHVRHNPLAEVARFVPRIGRSLRRHRWANLGAAAPWPRNVTVRPLSMAYVRRDGIDPGLGRRLGRRLAGRLAGRRDVGLLHGHFLHPLGLAAVTAASRLGLPAVVTGHGYDVYDLPERGPEWRRTVLDAVDGADAVTTVSDRNAALLLRLGVPRAKLHVIPNGFDPQMFHPGDRAAARRRLGLPAERRILLAVGNLVTVKGHADLLDAVAPVARVDPTLLLAFVGDGDQRAALQAKAEELRLTDQVLFAGHRPHAEVPSWMDAADLFVLPSHAEGCVTVVQEALGSGLPVVATDVGQVPQVVTAANGRMVPPRRPDAFAASIVDALATPFDREAIARAAQDTTWEANARRTMQVYARLAPGLALP